MFMLKLEYRIIKGVSVMKLLSPRLDVVFKKLFAEPDNRSLLTDFLSCVLEVKPA